MRFFPAIMLLLMPVWLQAQIPLKSWRVHLPYHQARHLAVSPTKVYCTTGENLFSYRKSDNSIEKLTKITGLSDFAASTIAWSEQAGVLVIGYDNGNIDIVKGKSIINVSDLNRKLLPASKAVNHICFDGNMAYLSCGFGIVLLDLQKNEIKDTYIFGPGGTYIHVNSCTILGNTVYAATASGIYRAAKNDNLLVDYNRWSRITDIPHADKAFVQVTTNNDILYAVYSNPAQAGDSIYYLRNNTWNSFRLDENTDIYNLSFSADQIYVSTSINLKVYDHSFQLKNTIWQYGEYGNAAPRESYPDKQGNLWIADFTHGLIVLQSNGRFRKMLPVGPGSSRVRSFHFSGNRLFAAAGGIDVSFGNLYNTGEISVFENDEWSPLYNFNHFDFMAVKSDPLEKDLFYVSSWGAGIFSYRNGEVVNHYNENNSTLQNAAAGGPNTRVWGMDFDSKGNLWVSNSLVNNTLSVLKRGGGWVGYPLRNAINADIAGEVVVDNYDHIWVALMKGGGIMVLNTNNTPDNTADDQLVKFKPKNAYGQIISNVYTLARDLEGNIWVGTDFGPVVYSNPDEVFTGNTDGKQPTLPRYDGTDQVDPLLGSEIIRTIAVDGANRKWIGTERGGAFLVSASGDSSLLQFNTGNSPILSNTIIGIGIHDKTGEVFFGTDRGIISYRSDATRGDENFGDVYAFPNPVRPGYNGDITITGLIRDANVKITDIAGNLVFETTTLGGQVVWNGRNLDGRKVASGVYIAFITNSDGSKTHLTKILILK